MTKRLDILKSICYNAGCKGITARFFRESGTLKHLAKPNGKVFSKSVIGTSERNTEDVLSDELRRTEKHVVAQWNTGKQF